MEMEFIDFQTELWKIVIILMELNKIKEIVRFFETNFYFSFLEPFNTRLRIIQLKCNIIIYTPIYLNYSLIF
jgi:hypothetical protein